LPEQTGSYGGNDDQATTRERHARAEQEAPPRPQGVVDLEDFDSTLYFLDESEVNTLAREVEEEYRRDVRGAALNALFDLLEMEGDPAIRGELVGILEHLFPNFLNARDFATAAMVLRECKLVAQRAPALEPALRERLDGFLGKMSEPAIVNQLIQSLDEAPAMAGDAQVAEVLRELRASALEPVLTWIPNLSSAAFRTLLEGVVDRLAASHPAEVLRILRNSESPALEAVITLCGRLGIHQAVPGLGETVTHREPAIRLASVQALALLGTPTALALLDKAVEDPDRGVRLAAVRAVGSRGYKGALRRVQAIVLGNAVKDMDLTEKMAFFEAYGAIAGAAGLKPLSGILLSRGLFKLKEPSEVRACAAIALGKIRTAEARETLQRAAEDKDLVVRNAVSRALRENTP
jgi:HEAT repeat protein